MAFPLPPSGSRAAIDAEAGLSKTKARHRQIVNNPAQKLFRHRRGGGNRTERKKGKKVL
jgi:hypothetical protein